MLGRGVVLSREALLSTTSEKRPVSARIWRHRLRWARSTRRSRRLGYVGEVFTKPFALSLLLALVASGYWARNGGVLTGVLDRSRPGLPRRCCIFDDENTPLPCSRAIGGCCPLKISRASLPGFSGFWKRDHVAWPHSDCGSRRELRNSTVYFFSSSISSGTTWNRSPTIP